MAEKKISNEGLLERLELIAGLIMNYLQYLKENDIALDYQLLKQSSKNKRSTSTIGMRPATSRMSTGFLKRSSLLAKISS